MPREELFYNIQNAPLKVPKSLSFEAKDLLKSVSLNTSGFIHLNSQILIIFQLLQRDPKNRLGAGKRGANELKSHAFFKNINWEDVYQK